MKGTSRFRWRRWLLNLVVLALLSVGGLIAWTQTGHFERSMARLLQWELSRRTGEDVVIGGLAVDWLRPAARVEGLVVSHVSEERSEDGATIAAVESVTLRPGFEGGRPVLRRLEIDRPDVRLHIDSDGLREFRELLGGEGAPGSEQVPWRELIVRNGAVQVEGARWRSSVTGLQVAPATTVGHVDIEAAVLAVRVGDFEQAAAQVRLPGVLVTPQRLLAPTLDVDFGQLQMGGDVDIQFGGPLAGQLHARIALPMLDPLLGEETHLLGEALVEVELLGTTTDPGAKGAVLLSDLHLLRGLIDADPDGADAPVDYDFGDISAGWRFEGRQAFLDPLVAHWGGGAARIEGAIDLLSTGMWLSLSTEGLSLYRVLQQANASPDPWVDLAVDADIQLAGTLSPLDMAGSAKLALDDLAVGAGPVHESQRVLSMRRIRAQGQLRLNDERIRIDLHELAADHNQGTVSATIGFAPQGPLDVDVHLSQVGLADFQPLYDVGLLGRGRLDCRVSGPFNALGIQASGDLRDFGILDIRFADTLGLTLDSPEIAVLDFTEMHGRTGDSRYAGRVLLDLRAGALLDLNVLLSEGRVEDLVGIFIDPTGLSGRVEGTIELHGDPSALDGEVLLDADTVMVFGEPFDDGRARAAVRDGSYTIDDLVLTREAGAESVVVRGTVSPAGDLNLDLQAGGFRLEDMVNLTDLPVRVRGMADLSARVGGTLGEPEPEGRLAVHQAWLAGRRVADSAVRFSTTEGVLVYDGRLLGQELVLDGSLDLWTNRAWTVDATLDGFPLHAFYPEAVDGQSITARVYGRADLSGALSDPSVPLRLEATADRVDAGWDQHELTSEGPWTLSVRGSTVRLDGVNLAGGGTRLALSGTSDRGSVDFTGGGTADLDLLRAFVPGLERADGLLDVSLAYQGTSDGAVPRIRLGTSQALLRADWFPHAFEQVDAVIEATPTRIDVQRASGRLGGGSFTVEGGIAAQNFRPVRYDLRSRIRDARVRYLDFLPPIVGNADLTFDGPPDELLLSGRIDVSDMQFTERIDWESWLLDFTTQRLGALASEEEEALFVLDLELVAPDTVRMRNNVADLTASARLRFVGDTARPGMVGDIRAVRGGRVYLKEREFELVRGEVRYVDPFTYDPELDILLRTDVRAREDDYRIDYRIAGVYSDWYAETTSDPPLAQADVNALLLFGMTRAELEQYGGLAAVLATEGGDLFAAKLGLAENVGEGVTRYRFLEPFRPDRLDIVSGASERGSGTVSSDLRLLYENDLGDFWVPMPDTRVIFEQNIYRLSDRYLGVEHQLARTLYARGFWSTELLGGKQVRGGAYGLEFNVRWEAD